MGRGGVVLGLEIGGQGTARRQSFLDLSFYPFSRLSDHFGADGRRDFLVGEDDLRFPHHKFHPREDVRGAENVSPGW